MDKLKRVNLWLIYYSLAVILWGAWVRISKSGDGCGEHWPLCHGEWIPSAKPIATWIEFSHRLSTAVYGFLVLYFVYLAFRHADRRLRGASLWVLFFTLTESLIGAQLVLKGLVGADASLARAYWMAIHQINSMLLTGSLVLCYDFLHYPFLNGFKKYVFSFSRYSLLWLAFLFVAAAGALASLSGTLFPSEDLLLGLFKDFSADSHWLVRLRISHPLLASCFALGLLYTLSTQRDYYACFRRRSFRLGLLTSFALAMGYVTLFSLSPTALKLSHLAMAHILWMYFLLWINSADERS